MSVRGKAKQFKQLNGLVEAKQKKLGHLFSRRARVAEKKVKEELSSALIKASKLRTDEGIIQFSNILKRKVGKIIAKDFVKPFEKVLSGHVLSTTKGSLIERAVAEATVFSSKQVAKMVGLVSPSSIVETSLAESLKSSQAVLASRVVGFGEEYTAGVNNWIQTNIVERMVGGADSAEVAIQAEKMLSAELSPFRVRNVTPETRLAIIGMAGPKVAIKNSLSAASEDIDSDLYAKSMAIHDGRAYPDSLEAEELTQDWVPYPNPYLEMTEFRRRPNDRCYDVIITAEEYKQLIGADSYEERLAEWQAEEEKQDEEEE